MMMPQQQGLKQGTQRAMNTKIQKRMRQKWVFENISLIVINSSLVIFSESDHENDDVVDEEIGDPKKAGEHGEDQDNSFYGNLVI
jgi:hypothetical protein